MAEGKPGRGSDQFPLRLPNGMRDALKAAADESGRSMNAEIVARLADSFSDEQGLWDEVNRIAEALEGLSRTVADIAPKVDSLWRKGES